MFYLPFNGSLPDTGPAIMDFWFDAAVPLRLTTLLPDDGIVTSSSIRSDNSTKLSALPTEMELKIFSNLTHGDILQVRLVCKDWLQLARSNELERKSKLIISKQNLEDICHHTKRQVLKLPSRVKETFKELNQLEILNITNNNRQELKRVILENLPKEARLNTIHLCIRDGEEDLLELVVQKCSSSLESLNLKFDNLTKRSVKQLNFMSGKVSRLALTGLGAHDLLHSIAPKTNKILTDMTLHDLDAIEESFSTLIQRLPNLIKLDLQFTEITDEVMGSIFHRLTQLRPLLLDTCKGETGIKYLCSKSNISRLKQLQTLCSCFCPIKVLQILNLKN
uniref:F-box domain-containing protein n=1 Tax=Glossina brevipalpis TaxID=37001 RepID=A0A1A9WXR1_9MUSC